ncbi:hypothetical protein HYU19_02635 [Candidatus Woesearchaeota archaeon]|nr:hypothetical protein [Candidatus Woesearchaeota archaeon]
MKKFKATKNSILQQEEPIKKRFTMKTILAIAIAGIMAFSIIGFVWTGVLQQPAKYNGVRFEQVQNGWIASFDGEEASFAYHPLDVEYLNLSSGVRAALQDVKALYFTSDIDDSLKEGIAQASYDLTGFLQQKEVYAVTGFTANTSFGKPVITCGNATAYTPVIYFRNSTGTEVTVEGSCIMVQANTPAGMAKLRDRLAYHFLGVIE